MAIRATGRATAQVLPIALGEARQHRRNRGQTPQRLLQVAFKATHAGRMMLFALQGDASALDQHGHIRSRHGIGVAAGAARGLCCPYSTGPLRMRVIVCVALHTT